MPLISFPDIPKLPGVPLTIPRLPSSAKAVVVSVFDTVQGLLWRAFQVDDRWGIWVTKGDKTYPLGFNSEYSETLRFLATSVGVATSNISVFSVEYTKETSVMDTPIEEGSFATYNKAEMPATSNVTLNVAGSENDRRYVLESIDKAVKSTDLFSVVTPEKTYIDYAIDRYSYSRKAASGINNLQIEIALKEVRQVKAEYGEKDKTTPAITDPKNADAKPPVGKGTTTPRKSVARRIWDWAWGIDQ